MERAVRQTYSHVVARTVTCNALPSNSPSSSSVTLASGGISACRRPISAQCSSSGRWPFLPLTTVHSKGMAAATIDHTGHQHHTAASGSRAIQQDGQARLGQCLEQRASERQPQRLGGTVLMLNKAPVARDQTFVLAPTGGGRAGQFVELNVLGTDDATNQQGQRVEVLFGMAVGAGVQRLRQRAFDGTIGLEVDVHGMLLSSGLVTLTSRIPCTLASDYRIDMPSHTISSYFLYGSEQKDGISLDDQ